ncbi:MAG: thiamine pyrophosphate-dependent dehydrogenase E1 component subunit alpha [Abitibacteriaceae bacterium]|nr:thiamine pyrophosphate-dependent dehydrogenase E1 component subunit alpha [Abditibacteriaceae bacterium]MBV9865293.1 thiamine pyrophosphate-dependent dehydrogenase E1 component subunit alpha [Abditibacteriaceae bacterium]
MDLSPQELLPHLRMMLLIRRFEERLDELFASGLIKGTSHLYAGQEAVAVGLCSVLTHQDYITSTHRGHGHFLAKGGDAKALMAELFGKVTGPSKGRGGSQHVADYRVGFLGSNGITAGGLPIATGAALAIHLRQEKNCVISFFGEGGSNQGTFHESINMAAIWRLPILYVCENNLYAMSTRYDEAFATPTIAARAAGYGIPGEVVDGTDFFAVRAAGERAVQRARQGEGPTLLEMQTYRYYGHSKSDKREYRTREEEAEWQSRDCIEKLRLSMHFSDESLHALDAEVLHEVDEAVEFAMQSPEPAVEEWEDVVYA